MSSSHALQPIEPARPPSVARSAAARGVLAVGLALGVVAGRRFEPAAGATPGRYVALGDSFTAGPLIPNQSLSPLGCLRSDQDYPHEVQRLAFDHPLDVSAAAPTPVT